MKRHRLLPALLLLLVAAAVALLLSSRSACADPDVPFLPPELAHGASHHARPADPLHRPGPPPESRAGPGKVGTRSDASPSRRRRAHDRASTLMCSSSPLNVTFGGGNQREWKLFCGQRLAREFTQEAPRLSFDDADVGATYALVMLDRDAPSRDSPSAAPYVHWIVGDVRGDELASGSPVSVRGLEVEPYMPPSPPPSTGYHRYALFLFRQPRFHIQYRPLHGSRARFNVTDWAWRYDLGRPEAASFFRTRDAPEDLANIMPGFHNEHH